MRPHAAYVSARTRSLFERQAFVAYWFLRRRSHRALLAPAGGEGEIEEIDVGGKTMMRVKKLKAAKQATAKEVYVPSATLVAQEYWDAYDKAQGWTSSIAGSAKTSNMVGGKSMKGPNRPLDVLVPRWTYVPKKRGWEGSGSGTFEGNGRQWQWHVRGQGGWEGRDICDSGAPRDEVCDAGEVGRARREQ